MRCELEFHKNTSRHFSWAIRGSALARVAEGNTLGGLVGMWKSVEREKIGVEVNVSSSSSKVTGKMGKFRMY